LNTISGRHRDGTLHKHDNDSTAAIFHCHHETNTIGIDQVSQKCNFKLKQLYFANRRIPRHAMIPSNDPSQNQRPSPVAATILPLKDETNLNVNRI
jgi:hypothetical protein